MLFYFLSAVSLILLGISNGYYYCKGDLDTYIPFVLHASNPDLLKNDLLTQTINVHPVYIWKFFGFLVKFINIELLFQFAFLFQTILISFGFILFYKQYFGNSKKGLLLFFLLLIIPAHTPAFGMVGINPYGYFHASALAMGFMLVFFVLIDKRNWMLSGIISGFLFLFHPITATFSAMYFFSALFVDFFDIRNKDLISKRYFLFKSLSGITLLFLIASPSWVPHLHHLAAAGSSGFNSKLWRLIIEKRMGFGFFISNWVSDRYFQTALVASIVIFTKKRFGSFKTLPIVLSSTIVIILLIISDIFNIRSILQLQQGRMLLYIYIFASGATANIFSGFFENKAKTPKLLLVLWTVLFAYFAYAHSLNEYHNAPLFLLISAIVITAICAATIPQSRSFRTVYVMLLIPVMIITGFHSYNFFKNWQSDVDNPQNSWHNIQTWCKDNTPPDAVILTPIYLDGFRIYSQRAIFASYKDGAPHNFNEKTIFEWWRRMLLFGTIENLNGTKFPHIYNRNCLNVALKENIRYVVYEKKFFGDSSLKPVYSNSDFAILDLNNRMPSSEN